MDIKFCDKCGRIIKINTPFIIMNAYVNIEDKNDRGVYKLTDQTKWEVCKDCYYKINKFINNK
jgi:hypothetical protein